MFHNRVIVITGAFLVACVAALLGFTGAQASPAAPGEFTLTQPDGSTFQAHQWGDEWNHGTETVEGYSILKDPGNGLLGLCRDSNPMAHWPPDWRMVNCWWSARRTPGHSQNICARRNQTKIREPVHRLLPGRPR